MEQIQDQWERSSMGGASITSQNFKKDIAQEYILKFSAADNPLVVTLPQAYFTNEAKRFIQLVHFDMQCYKSSEANWDPITLPCNVMIRLGNTANGASYDKNGKPTDVFEIATLFSYSIENTGIVKNVVAVYQNRQTDLDKESVKLPINNQINIYFTQTLKDGSEVPVIFPTVSLSSQLNWDRYNITLRIVDLNT